MSLKLESRHDANFAVTGSTGGCHNDNSRITIAAKIAIMTTLGIHVPSVCTDLTLG